MANSKRITDKNKVKKKGPVFRHIMYNGEVIAYKTPQDLSRKLKIDLRTSKDLIKNQSNLKIRETHAIPPKKLNRIAIGPDGETAKFNLATDKFKGMLKRDFNIPNAKFHNERFIKKFTEIKKGKEDYVDVSPFVSPETTIKVQISITLYFTYSSPGHGNSLFLIKDSIIKNNPEIIVKGDDGYHRIDKVLPYSTIDKNKLDRMRIIDDIERKNAINHLEDMGLNVINDINPYFEERKKSFTYHGKPSQLSEFILNKIYEKKAEYEQTGAKLRFYEKHIGDYFSDRKMELKDGYLRDNDNIFELTEWVNIEYNNKGNEKDTCVPRYFSQKYPEYYWDVKKLETPNGVLTRSFLDFCESKNIAYNVYDEKGKKIFECKGNNGKINAIVFNNHIYPVNGGKPRKYKSKNQKIELIKNSADHLIKIINEKKMPSNIKIDNGYSNKPLNNMTNINIISYCIKDTKFICNDQYEGCLKFLEKIGYSEYIFDDIKYVNLPIILEKILHVPDVSSFSPLTENYKSASIFWKKTFSENNELTSILSHYDVNEIKTIDKNKAYPYILYSLPYLLKFNYRSNKIKKVEGVYEIKGECLYLAKAKYWTYLMPTLTATYWGDFLIFCRNKGIEFEILEELETEHVPNYTRQIIPLLRDNLPEDIFKEIMVIYIGKMERSSKEVFNYKYKTICNSESVNMHDGFKTKLGENHYVIYDEKKSYNYAKNRFPIAIMIKDSIRRMVYEKIQEIGLSDDQIIQINTDEISYIGKDYPKNLGKEFEGWKKKDFGEIGNSVVNDNMDIKSWFFRPEYEDNKDRILYSTYAGSGKTYKILNEIIPKLKEKNISYIVLTPTHKVASTFKKLGIKCDVIQTYMFSNTIPDEDYIIIDEIGSVSNSCHDILYHIKNAGKSYYCFGDFQQLLPIGETKQLNQPHYLNYMFSEIYTEFVNHRNNFTKEYYQDIIDGKKDNISEIKKWSEKKFYDAENILCVRHDTKNMYNEKMINHLKLKYWCSIGAKIICTTNKLLKRSKDPIYHYQDFTISKYDKDNKIYTIIDDDNKEYQVTKQEMISNFDNSYAINIHQAQGTTMGSYYWASEDDVFINEHTGNMAYTIISRLKQKN